MSDVKSASPQLELKYVQSTVEVVFLSVKNQLFLAHFKQYLVPLQLIYLRIVKSHVGVISSWLTPVLSLTTT
jgi:hypothetical protein